jgi:hypothetical protein
LKRRPAWIPARHFVVHYLEMVVSMVAGVILLDSVWTTLWPACLTVPVPMPW